MAITDLNFEAKFEAGNLQTYEKITPFEYDIYIRPDPGSSSCLWFYFCVNCVTLHKPYIFHIIGFSKPTTTFRTEQTPLVRSTSRTRWEHIPKTQCWYGNTLPRHKLKATYPVLSFIFQFDKNENYFFVFTYPYTYSMTVKFLARLREHKLSFVRINSLGKTPNGNDIPILMISQGINSDLVHTPAFRERSAILITSRVHSGEVPSSFVMHGILEFLITNNPKAKFLRERIVFLLIPMVNPDGCSAGNYRANGSGADLNRCYTSPHPDLHREAYKIRRLFLNLLLSYEYQQVSTLRRTEAETIFLSEDLNRLLYAKASNLNIETTYSITNMEQDSNGMQASVSSGSKRPLRLTPEELEVSWEPGFEFLAGLRLDFALDLHSHSCLSGGFLFYNPDSGVACPSIRHACELVFPTILARRCLAFGALRQDDKVGVQLRDTPGSLRRIFNLIAKQYCADNSPYIYGMEVTNSHGPNPALEHTGAQVTPIEEADDEDRERELEDTTATKTLIYTPKEWLTIGEKVSETFYDIYSSKGIGE
ncbi:Nuclear ATP/GTP-binding protein [Giardia muris]|uniref:Nuclear ATP/GTP-binding protein n=1 Tax=Giardia muris TaxID=5742 RepID=A0A4Z1SUE0_GIAMU|nr:Nuclear ATP/GTP-binding protein [Giardia muris]|eukprot:TNJ29486.1 Nuclear ATP/GTP-binding protein [Giardia muris]